jgi:hypothetical protein
MMIKGPQTINNSLTNLDTQSPVSRPEINRGVQTPVPAQSEQQNYETQSQTTVEDSPAISAQQVKNLSEIYNSYRSYVNQLETTDRLVNRVAYGATNIADLLK